MKRPGPKLVPLGLTDDERCELRRWTRQHKLSQQVALRARIVLACDQTGSDGLPVSQAQVARDLCVSVATVRKWRRRFSQQRLEGLADAPRPGRPRTIIDEQIVALIVEGTAERPSTRAVAARAGVSQSTVSRVWRHRSFPVPAKKHGGRALPGAV
ncbi:helix-turn-helix domain-containing protein [Nocardiopsis quinghaiensis]|uniref:helix-turn-helix domain-containing protein n=1 Tax=Nocardiopsis quinghaiensis TaxID=464995 RepID=UPI00123AA67D|nr:helix-turn-helix domain-containing protein [Nocardiopsis quinghaiensis]